MKKRSRPKSRKSSNSKVKSSKRSATTINIPINDLCFIDKGLLNKCFTISKDLYVKEAVKECIDTVFQGGISVKVAMLNYHGYSIGIQNNLERNLRRALKWYFCTGFIPFGFIEGSSTQLRYLKQQKEESKKREKMEQKKGRRPADIMKDELKNQLPGISSLDTTRSKKFDDFMKSNTNNNNFGGGTNYLQGPHSLASLPGSAIQFSSAPIPQSLAGDSFMAYSNQSSSSNPGDEDTFNVPMLLKFKELVDISLMNAENGDLDFFVPDTSADIGTFVRYTEKGTFQTKMFIRSNEDNESSSSDSSDIDYSSSEEEEEKEKEKMSNNSNLALSFNPYPVVLENNGNGGNVVVKQYKPKRRPRQRKRQRTFESKLNHGKSRRKSKNFMYSGIAEAIGRGNSSLIHVSLIDPVGSVLEAQGIGPMFENHPSRELVINGTGDTNISENQTLKRRVKKLYGGSKAERESGDGNNSSTESESSDEEDNSRINAKLKKERYSYYVFVVEAPDADGMLNSHISSLIESYDYLKQHKKDEKVFNQKTLYPTPILQRQEDRSGASKTGAGSKLDDLPSSIRQTGAYKNVAEQILSAKLAVEQQGDDGSRSGPSKYPTPQELTQRKAARERFEKEAIKLTARHNQYSEAYRRGVLDELDTDLVLSMQAYMVPEGFQLVNMYQPPALQTSYQDALQIFVKEVCVTFGIPKRRFDIGGEKWKIDVTSESDPFVSKLTELRKTLTEFFTEAYNAKNGFNINEKNVGGIDDNNIYQDFKKQLDVERQVLDDITKNILQLTLELPGKIKQSLKEFVKTQTEKIENELSVSQNKEKIQKMQLELAQAIVTDRMKEIGKQGKDRSKPAPKPKPTGTGAAAKPPAPPSPVEMPDLESILHPPENQNGGGSGGGSGGKSGSNGEGEISIPLDDGSHLEPNEKNKHLLLLHKVILWCNDTMQRLDEVMKIIREYSVKNVRLVFDSPLFPSMDSIQKYHSVVPLSENKLRKILGAKYGDNQ